MPEASYLIIAVVVSGIITVALRALPFAILKPLRKSKFVQALGRWMPAGILLILAVVVLRGGMLSRPGDLWAIIAATVVTVVVHLLGKRRALLSIAAGTTCYVLLLNLM